MRDSEPSTALLAWYDVHARLMPWRVPPDQRAAGVLPATIRYWLDHVPGASASKVGDFLLTAAAVGGLCKHNASISGAECGCQAEVGSAAAMAAVDPVAVHSHIPDDHTFNELVMS